MNNLIIPNRPPPPKTGINYTVSSDAGNVVIVITSTLLIPPDNARGLAAGLLQAAEMAEAFRAQVLQVNGVQADG